MVAENLSCALLRFTKCPVNAESHKLEAVGSYYIGGMGQRMVS